MADEFIVSGDYEQIPFRIVKEGQPVDLTGHVLTFTALAADPAAEEAAVAKTSENAGEIELADQTDEETRGRGKVILDGEDLAFITGVKARLFCEIRHSDAEGRDSRTHFELDAYRKRERAGG